MLIPISGGKTDPNSHCYPYLSTWYILISEYKTRQSKHLRQEIKHN